MHRSPLWFDNQKIQNNNSMIGIQTGENNFLNFGNDNYYCPHCNYKHLAIDNDTDKVNRTKYMRAKKEMQAVW